MSIKKLRSAGKILDAIKNREELPTDAKLAEFIGVKAGTVSAWRSRNTLDWELILTKCSDYATDILYNVDNKDLKAKSTAQEKPITYDPDPEVRAYEQKIKEIARGIEHGPFSQGLKVRLFDSLLNMIGEELDALHMPSDPNTPHEKEK